MFRNRIAQARSFEDPLLMLKYQNGVIKYPFDSRKDTMTHANFFNPDWMVTNARIEIFTEKAKVEEIVAAIMEIAHTSMPGDGIVAVLPVEKLYRIRTKSEALPDEI